MAKVFSNTMIFALQKCENYPFMFSKRISMHLPYLKIEILMSRYLTISLHVTFEQMGPECKNVYGTIHVKGGWSDTLAIDHCLRGAEIVRNVTHCLYMIRHIRTVWSGSLLSAYRILGYCRLYRRSGKLLTRLSYTQAGLALCKQAYSNILKILPPKNENFQIKILIFFFIFLLKT